ncbi:hypothetical protein COB72_08265 [bacterium]|nr:MAG: hypothetical protein COB72_08265 [bacterium]
MTGHLFDDKLLPILNEYPLPVQCPTTGKRTVIRFNSPRRSTIAQAFVCAAALLVCTPIATAQSNADLPRSTINAISIGSTQHTQINEFIQAWSERALSDKAQDTKRAIDALTKPLTGGGASVAFRQSYSISLTPLLDELKNKGTIGATIASLKIAGDLATSPSATRVRNAMKHEDLGVQLFAVSRAGQIFTTTIAYGPAMTANDTNALINAIDKLASDESINPELFRTCVRALSTATMLSSKDMGNERSHAIIALSQAIGSRLRGLNVSDDPSYTQGIALEAAGAMTASIADISSSTTSEAAKEAIGLSGDIISITLRRLLGKTLNPVDRRDLAVRSVQAGENLLYFALKKDAELNGSGLGTINPTKFADQLTEGDDRKFRNGASSLFGDGSKLCRRFKFVNGRFVR